MDDVEELLARQAGVIARGQALELGLLPHDIRRRLRRREWALVHPGVYAAHTGPLGWLERAWAATLLLEPAALWGESAVRAADGPGRDVGPQTIHVAVDRWRSSLRAPDGIVIHHVSRLGGRVLWNASPPRMRYEEAALDVALAAPSDLAAIAALAKGCQSRRTTARRLLVSLASRPRVGRRTWLQGVLTDIAEGSCSVLEHGYLTRVERPHGLRHAERQVRATASVGVVYRDVEYAGQLVVELDGRLHHDTASQRDRDFERDLDVAAQGRSTVRLSYGQVFERSCSTASKIGAVLRAHGLSAAPHPCCETCVVGRAGWAA